MYLFGIDFSRSEIDSIIYRLHSILKNSEQSVRFPLVDMKNLERIWERNNILLEKPRNVNATYDRPPENIFKIQTYIFHVSYREA